MHAASTTPGPNGGRWRWRPHHRPLRGAARPRGRPRGGRLHRPGRERRPEDRRRLGERQARPCSSRLAPRDVLEIDVGSDGTADFSFDRSTFTAIEVKGRSGDDEIRVSHLGGAFPDEALTMMGERRRRHAASAAIGDRDAPRRLRRRRRLRRGRERHRRCSAAARTPFTWNPGDDNDTVEGQTGDDTLDFNGAQRRRAHRRCRRRRHACASPATSRTSSWTSTDVEHIGFDAFGGADTVVVTDLAGTDAERSTSTSRRRRTPATASRDTVIARGADGDDVLRGEPRHRPASTCSHSPAGHRRHRRRARQRRSHRRGRRRHDTVRYSGTAATTIDSRLRERHRGRRGPARSRADRRRRGREPRPARPRRRGHALRHRQPRAADHDHDGRRRRRRHAAAAATAPTCCSATTATTTSTATRASTRP